eukprot:m.447981 g.447981  ORF g.447981 m.447981 type:complete len:69 (+) comp19594_c0_seq1:2476-2682(+)
MESRWDAQATTGKTAEIRRISQFVIINKDGLRFDLSPLTTPTSHNVNAFVLLSSSSTLNIKFRSQSSV